MSAPIYPERGLIAHHRTAYEEEYSIERKIDDHGTTVIQNYVEGRNNAPANIGRNIKIYTGFVCTLAIGIVITVCVLACKKYC